MRPKARSYAAMMSGGGSGNSMRRRVSRLMVGSTCAVTSSSIRAFAVGVCSQMRSHRTMCGSARMMPIDLVMRPSCVLGGDQRGLAHPPDEYDGQVALPEGAGGRRTARHVLIHAG